MNINEVRSAIREFMHEQIENSKPLAAKVQRYPQSCTAFESKELAQN